MRPNKERFPYYLYRRHTPKGNVWYARFWNEETKEYDRTRSTGVPVEGKKERRREALVARGNYRRC
jgi:hypothetical protein